MSKPVLAHPRPGLMGHRMTKRLLAAGYQVHVWNRSKQKLAPARALGAIAAESPGVVVRKTDLIMMCCFDAKAVEEVVFGGDAVAKAAGAGEPLNLRAQFCPHAPKTF